MVDGPTEIEDLDKTEENKTLVTNFCNDILIGGQANKVTAYISIDYTYETPGTYETKLTISDEAGLTGTASQSVQINQVVEITPTTTQSGTG